MTSVASTNSAETVASFKSAERAFSRSMVVSGLRCGITYLLIPFVFPILGFGTGAGPAIGIPLGLAAIVANVVSFRRFQKSGHRLRVLIMAINSGVVALLIVLLAIDISQI